MTAYFVTATGTDIGKTYVTAALAHALRSQARSVSALKPVISGFTPETCDSSDTAILLRATGQDVTPETIAATSPWRFRAPLSPDMAAAREGGSIDFTALIRFCTDQVSHHTGTMLIEGVGGVMVPIDQAHTVLDWMAALNLPVLLITGSYLGSISHTLTALAVLRQAGIETRAIIINETPDSTVDLLESAATIRRFSADVEILPLPRHHGDDPLTALAARL